MDENNGSLGNQPSSVNAGGAVPTPTNPTMPSTPDGAMTNAPMPEAPVAPDAPSTPGIIASTPEVVAPPSDEEVANASANLAPRRPFFADHPTQTTASGTGDIILEKTKTPGSKKPLIIALIIGAVVLVVVVVLLMVNRPVSSEELISTFSEYQDLLINGPSDVPENDNAELDSNEEVIIDDDEEDDEAWDDYDYVDEDYDPDDSLDIAVIDDDEEDDDAPTSVVEFVRDDYEDNDDEEDEEDIASSSEPWFFFTLGSSNLSVDEKKSYIEDLETKYTSFASGARKSNKGNTDALEMIDNYSALFNSLSRYVMLSTYEEDVKNDFLAGGSNQAQNYINSVTPEKSNYDLADAIDEIFVDKLKSSLHLLEIYDKLGCINNSIVDTFCDLDGNKEYDDFMQDYNMKNLENENSVTSVYNLFTMQTYMVGSLIGDSANE